MSETIIVVGAGHAGCQTVVSLRQEGYTGRLILIGDESQLPYHRPPLSKKYLAGQMPSERLLIRPASFYQNQQVEIISGCLVTRIDRNDRHIDLSDGQRIGYHRLVLATGSYARRLRLANESLEGVSYLRSITDVEQIRSQLGVPPRRIAVIGGGYIGLEVAATLNTMGHQVIVLEAAERLLGRVTSPAMSAHFLKVHRTHGVQIKLQTVVTEIVGSHRVRALRTSAGDVACDLAIIGVGVIPNDELAQQAGLRCNQGIVVDAHCRTEDPAIFAAGDCTRYPSRLFNRQLLLESVQNATDQARVVAKNLNVEDTIYDEVPWFWSDQFDIKWQIAGLSQGYDQMVVRGLMEENNFCLLYLSDGKLLAADVLNNPREFMVCRQLIRNQARIPAARLADRTQSMKEMLDSCQQ